MHFRKCSRTTSSTDVLRNLFQFRVADASMHPVLGTGLALHTGGESSIPSACHVATGYLHRTNLVLSRVCAQRTARG